MFLCCTTDHIRLVCKGLNPLIFTPGDGKLALDQPCCKAIYSFHPDQEGELDFDEGDVITLSKQVDANWYEGVLRGRSGLFPISYVDVLVPLPLP